MKLGAVAVSFAVLTIKALAIGALAGPEQDLLATDKAFSDLSVAKGAHAAFLAYMTDDARLYEGEHPPILGKAAAAALYAKEDSSPGHKASRLEWTPLEARTSPDGILGWTRGTWVWSSGDAKRLTGYYVTEWRRQVDGHYKFELDIGGTDKP